MRHDIIEHALRDGGQCAADAPAVALSTEVAVRLLLSVLEPLVGELAACALYRRSVHLARAALPRAPLDADSHDDLLAPLRLHLAARSPAEARQVSRALLNALVDLLVSLIGEPLTHKLLVKAWGGAEEVPAAQAKPHEKQQG